MAMIDAAMMDAVSAEMQAVDAPFARALLALGKDRADVVGLSADLSKYTDIGPFAEAPNVCVATGHEGAGIGLAPATGELIADWHTGRTPAVPIGWFSPDRFAPVELAAT